MINDPGYFYNHSKGILIYLIDKKENKKFAFYRSFLQPYEIMDDYEQYVFKTYNQEDKQIDTIQTGLPMNILQIVLMECDLKSPTTIPNYRLFSEDEKNEMRKYNGPLPEDENLYEKEMKVSDELPGLRVLPIVQRFRRNTPRLIPMPALEPHGEDVEYETEEIMEEKNYFEDLKIRVEIAKEVMEKQIEEHISIHKSYDRES
jgi:hypothetical protein